MTGSWDEQLLRRAIAIAAEAAAAGDAPYASLLADADGQVPRWEGCARLGGRG